MSTYILGISCYYHDASAALLKDGVVVAAAEEERFTRQKHDTSFPINAISYCLRSQNITIKDISRVGFYEKPLLKFERILFQHLEKFPFSIKTFFRAIPSWFGEKLRVLGAIRTKLKYAGDIIFVPHHLAHAASAFLVSPFSRAAVVTVDGVGEWTTTAYGIAEGSDIHLMKEIRFPHSLGLLYSTITAYLGFSVNNSEYKVMGLAAYGDKDKKTNQYYQNLRRIIDLKEDGSFCLVMDYFVYHYSDRMPSKKLCELLGGTVRSPKSEVTQRHKDIAAALQLVYEEALFNILNHVYDETRCENLVMAGGCSLNCVANGKILSNTPFKHVWIQPNGSDGGTSLGVASFIYHNILKNARSFVFTNAYLGPKYSKEEIRFFLDKNRIKHTVWDSEENLIEHVADLLNQNGIVGWFQGGMEWGPRALGARSILANPCNPAAKDLLNEKVKHREMFRPFAPAVCQDDALEYFVCDRPLPQAADFMLMAYPIKEQWRGKIPSVTHVDGSGRLQTVNPEENPMFYRLIKAFGKRSGIPILINTSFNIRGEPIVCSPQDAYRCMMGTQIDYLVMSTFVIKRGENRKDIWNSETCNKDIRNEDE